MINKENEKDKEISKKNTVSINELNKIEDKEEFNLYQVYLIDIFDIKEGTSKYGNPYRKRDISVGIYESEDMKIISEEIRITTFDEKMIKEFEKIPKNRLLNFKNVKKNTFRNRVNLLTTDETAIEIVKREREKEKEKIKAKVKIKEKAEEEKEEKTMEKQKKTEPEIKEPEIEKIPVEKAEQKTIKIKPSVKTFGNPRLEGLRIVQRGLETVLSGIDILIRIEEEKEKKNKD